MSEPTIRNLGKKPPTLRAKDGKQTFAERLKALPLAAKIGAGVGAGALLFFGAPAVIPVALGAAGLGGFYAIQKRRKYSPKMTAERIKVYEQALATLKDPKKLQILADEFEKAGCVKEAEHLRRRAALRGRTPAEKKADQRRYRDAMKNTDAKKVEAEAAYFESIGADGAAGNLRTRVKALKAVS